MSHNNPDTRISSSLTAIQGGSLSGNSRREDNHDERQDERQDDSVPASSGHNDPRQYELVDIQDEGRSTLFETTPPSNCSPNCMPEPVLDVQPTSRSHIVSSHDQYNGCTCSWVKEVAEQSAEMERFEIEQLKVAQRHAKALFKIKQSTEMGQFETGQSLEKVQLEVAQRYAKALLKMEQNPEMERLEMAQSLEKVQLGIKQGHAKTLLKMEQRRAKERFKMEQSLERVQLEMKQRHALRENVVRRMREYR